MSPRENGQRPGKFARFGLKALMAAMLIVPALSLGLAEPVADIAFAKKNTNSSEIGTEDFTAPRYRSTITIRDGGPASPYGSSVNVKGLSGTIVDVNLILLDVTHGRPSDISVMLEHAGRAAVVMRQAGDDVRIDKTNIVLDNQAAENLPETDPIFGNRAYVPQDYDLTNSPFGGGAPGNTDGGNVPRQYLDIFNGVTANGAWTLWVRDDRAEISGTMAGWQLEIVTDNTDPYIAKDKYKVKQGRKLRVSSNKGVLRSDPNRGQDLIVNVIQKPKKGKLKLRKDGSFKYKPKGNKKGKDSFTYRITDERGASIQGDGQVVIKIKKDKKKRRNRR